MSFRNRLINWLKEWMLALALAAGAGICLLYYATPALHGIGPLMHKAIAGAQPVLIFVMLFLSFCRVAPGDLRPHRWQVAPLLVQVGIFIALCLLLILARTASGGFFEWIRSHEIFVQGLLLCFITPTSNSCVVITAKLGGKASEAAAYTLFINLIVSFLIPIFLPLVHPMEGLSFGGAVLTILGRVLPLLIAPLLLAFFVRWRFPKLLAWILRHPDLPFYLWSLLLVVSICLATRVVVLFDGGRLILAELAVAALVACAFQLRTGRRIGRRYSREITAGLSMGQKNTAFAMWLGLTFLNPVVSVVGGFYSIWQNIYNTRQLRRLSRRKAVPAPSRERV